MHSKSRISNEEFCDKAIPNERAPSSSIKLPKKKYKNIKNVLRIIPLMMNFELINIKN